MAKLPDVSSLGQRPTPQVMPPVGASNIGFLFKAASDLGDNILRIGGQIQETVNNLRAEDSFNKLRDIQVELTTGDNGFVHKSGADAINEPILDNYSKQLDEATKNISSSLGNDKQRELFLQRANIVGIQFKSDLLRHITKERDSYAKEVFNSTMETEINNISQNYFDKNAVSVSEARISNSIEEESKRLGLSDEGKLSLTNKINNLIWKNRIDSQMVDDPVGALRTFEQNSSKLDPVTAVQLRRQLKVAALPIEAKRAADEAIGIDKPGSKISTKASLEDWLAKGDQIAESLHPGDVIFRDMVNNQINSYVSRMAAVRANISNQAGDTLAGMAMAVGKDTKPTSIEELLAMPGAKRNWGLLDSGQQRGILAILDRNVKDDNRSDPRVLDEVFQRIHTTPEDPNRIYSKAQLIPYFKGLGKVGYDWAAKEIEDRQTPEGERLADKRKDFFSGVKGQFDKSTMIMVDAKGGENFFKFKQYITGLERKLIVDGKDPYELYNPQSTEYAGKKIPDYQRSIQEQIRDMSESIRRSSAPKTPVVNKEEQRKPGESYSDWKKRVNP